MSAESRAPAQGASHTQQSLGSLHNVVSFRKTAVITPPVTRLPGERRTPNALGLPDTYPELLHDFDQVFEAYAELLVQYAHLFLELSSNRQEHILHCQLPFAFHRRALTDIHSVIALAQRGEC